MALQTKFEEIICEDNVGQMKDIDINTVIAKAQKEKVRPSVEDGKRALLIVVDMQNSFCAERGELTVWPGAKSDIINLSRFIYNNLENLTDIMCSLDTHTPIQIFFSSFWADKNGNPPAPFTMITEKDVQGGKYKPLHGNPVEALKCLKALNAAGKVGVCIWPYHCIIGTPGWALENELSKMVHFHAAARVTSPSMITKGGHIYSEMYGIISPEYNVSNIVTFEVLNAIADVGGSGKINYDQIFIAGEASSHCVLETARQILDRFSNQPEVLKRITILEDCTSPVASFEKVAEDGMAALKSKYGVRIAKSTDSLF